MDIKFLEAHGHISSTVELVAVTLAMESRSLVADFLAYLASTEDHVAAHLEFLFAESDQLRSYVRAQQVDDKLVLEALDKALEPQSAIYPPSPNATLEARLFLFCLHNDQVDELGVLMMMLDAALDGDGITIELSEEPLIVLGPGLQMRVGHRLYDVSLKQMAKHVHWLLWYSHVPYTALPIDQPTMEVAIQTYVGHMVSTSEEDKLPWE